MHDGDRLLIVLATYNEIESLPTLVGRLHEQLPAANLLVIDDNSPDGTGRWCDQQSRDMEKLEVCHRSGKLGLGSASMTGLKMAVERKFDFAATLDADLSHDPVQLKAMVGSLANGSYGDAGVLIGSRYAAGGTISGWPWYRLISSRLVNWFARFALRLPTLDNTSAMRVYSVSALESIDIGSVSSAGYSYLEEILVMLQRAGVKFAEYPIDFRNRDTGKSKVDIREMTDSLLKIIRLGVRSKRLP